MYTLSLRIDELLEPSLRKIKGQLREQLEKEAMEIVQQEVAKFAIDLSRFVNIKDMGSEIIITIHKDVKTSHT